MQKKSYIIATHNSNESIDIGIFTGTEAGLKVHMLNEVTKPVDEGFEVVRGADGVSDAIEKNGKYTAYAEYSDFNVTCSAVESPYNSHEIEKVCGNGNRIIASINEDPEYKEIFVGIQTPSGDYQDLAVIGEDYHYPDNSEGPVPDHNTFTVKVYGDSENEDFTEEFTIGLTERYV